MSNMPVTETLSRHSKSSKADGTEVGSSTSNLPVYLLGNLHFVVSWTSSHLHITGIFDEYLSLVYTCHVVWTVRMCSYLPLVHFSPPVSTCDAYQRNQQCLFTYCVESCCVPVTLYLTSREVICVCWQSVSCGMSSGQGHELRDCYHN